MDSYRKRERLSSGSRRLGTRNFEVTIVISHERYSSRNIT